MANSDGCMPNRKRASNVDCPPQRASRIAKERTMKAVILAGGMGTRISEESILRPKPMIEIGGKPIIWHIMKIFAHYGISEFIICLGYKGYIIKEYFANFVLHSAGERAILLHLWRRRCGYQHQRACRFSQGFRNASNPHRSSSPRAIRRS
jgi:hypothetical protein